MTSQTLREARKYEEAFGKLIKEDERPDFHLSPRTGWMNDPNGFSYYKGQYHMFYQYYPYESKWGPMHWGHAVSRDILHWEYLPLALAPSESYDDHMRGGCFSGSAIAHEGKLFLMFTGTAKEENGFVQTQCIAYSEDGIHFEKYGGNPVLAAPEGILPDQFRDPKVWEHEGMYYMVCGGSCGRNGQALLYRSKDMFHWTFFNVLAESRGEWGYMWECTDFFPMGGKYVLIFSPMGAGEHTAVYMVGDFDYGTGKFCSHINGEIDWGFDYYAPQSFQTPDGRRIIVGWEWMPSWKDWGPTYKESWCGFFNVPREVRMMEDGTLQFPPVKELEDLSQNPRHESAFAVTEEEKKLDVHILSDQSSLEIFVDRYQNNHSNNIYAGNAQNQL